MRPIVVWGLLGVLYAAFFLWYTPLGGPLSEEEVERYSAYFASRSSDPEALASVRKFLSEDTGGDFVMVNVMEMREPPAQVEGVEPGDSANDVLARYMAYMWPALLSRACHPVLMGQAAADAPEVWGIENGRRWSAAGMMRYRSRRDSSRGIPPVVR